MASERPALPVQRVSVDHRGAMCAAREGYWVCVADRGHSGGHYMRNAARVDE